MNVCDVCCSFGSYIRLQVDDSQDHGRAPTTTAPDAFAVLMANQRLLCSPTLPDCLHERTKDKLYNDLICLVDGMGLKWQSGEVNSGKSFLTTLTNAL